jgi:hypothetical protein
VRTRWTRSTEFAALDAGLGPDEVAVAALSPDDAAALEADEAAVEAAVEEVVEGPARISGDARVRDRASAVTDLSDADGVAVSGADNSSAAAPSTAGADAAEAAAAAAVDADPDDLRMLSWQTDAPVAQMEVTLTAGVSTHVHPVPDAAAAMVPGLVRNRLMGAMAPELMQGFSGWLTHEIVRGNRFAEAVPLELREEAHPGVELTYESEGDEADGEEQGAGAE